VPKAYTKRKFRSENKNLLNKLKYKDKYFNEDTIIYRKLERGSGYAKTEYIVGELPDNRIDAKAKNIPFYFHGKPCPEGHIAPYYVEANYCVSCTKIRTARSDRKNKKIYLRIKHFSLEGKILELMKMARNRARQYEGSTYEYNLTLDYMKKLWMSQNGYCFYTKEKLRFNDYSSEKYNHKNNLHKIKNFEFLETENEIKAYDSLMASIDKVVPAKGYTKGNVIFCTRSANYMKHDLDPKRFTEYAKTISSLNIISGIKKIINKAERIEVDNSIFVEQTRKEAKNQKKAEILFKYLLPFSKIKKTNRFFQYEFSKFVADNFIKKKDIIEEFEIDEKSKIYLSQNSKATVYFNSIIGRIFKKPKIIDTYKIEIVKSDTKQIRGLQVGLKKNNLLITKINNG